MVWENCNITLNSGGSGKFYTGNIVTGSVTLEFKKKQKIRNIEFKVMGVSKARWSRVAPTVPYLKVYSENNTILDTTLDIFDEINGKKVQPGIKDFQFDFTLPSDLPSTFKSSIASVHYFLEIRCKGPCNRKKVKVVPLIVLSNVDLNHIEDNKKLEYVVSTGYAKDEKKVCKIEHTDLSSQSKEYCRFFMDVPQVAPSSINVTNAMVNITYVLRVEVLFKFHLTLYEDIPVTVSTVPVQHFSSQGVQR